MKTNYFSIILLGIIINPFATFSQKIENNQFVLRYYNKIYCIEIVGNAILTQHQNDDFGIYDIHVNPSLIELIIFDKNREVLTKYCCTEYYIDGNNNIITLLAPPHYNTPVEYFDLWKIYINNELKYEDIIIDDEVKFIENDDEIKILSGSKIVVIIKKQ